MIFNLNEPEPGLMELHGGPDILARATRNQSTGRRGWRRHRWMIADPAGVIPYLTAPNKNRARSMLITMAFTAIADKSFKKQRRDLMNAVSKALGGQEFNVQHQSREPRRVQEKQVEERVQGPGDHGRREADAAGPISAAVQHRSHPSREGDEVDARNHPEGLEGPRRQPLLRVVEDR